MKPGEWIRVCLNRCRRALGRQWRFRMVFGERHADGRYLPNTRISPSTCIEHEEQLDLGDHVFIGHFNFLEASGGLVIEEGVQITNYVSVITHSTHDSVRITGRAGSTYPGARPGDRRAPVRIGAFSFIGPHSVIEPGAVLGRGCLVVAGSRVRGKHPDFAILSGNPATVVGDTRARDEALLQHHPEWEPHYRRWARKAEGATRLDLPYDSSLTPGEGKSE